MHIFDLDYSSNPLKYSSNLPHKYTLDVDSFLDIFRHLLSLSIVHIKRSDPRWIPADSLTTKLDSWHNCKRFPLDCIYYSNVGLQLKRFILISDMRAACAWITCSSARFLRRICSPSSFLAYPARTRHVLFIILFLYFFSFAWFVFWIFFGQKRRLQLIKCVRGPGHKANGHTSKSVI